MLYEVKWHDANYDEVGERIILEAEDLRDALRQVLLLSYEGDRCIVMPKRISQPRRKAAK